MRVHQKWFAFCLLWCGLGTLPAISLAEQASKVTAAAIKASDKTPYKVVLGTVVSRRDVLISALVEARLDSVVEQGQFVEKGQVIALFDKTMLQADLDLANSSLATQKTDAKYFHAEFLRQLDLKKKGLSSESEFDNARYRYDRAKQQVNAYQAQIAWAKAQLDKSEIKAPFAGQVVLHRARSAQWMRPGDPILRLIDNKNVHIKAIVPPSLISLLDSHQKIIVNYNQQQLAGKLVSITPLTSDVNSMVELLFEVDSSLPLGKRLTVQLHNTKLASVYEVPVDSLIYRDKSSFVFVIGNDNKVTKVNVTAHSSGSANTKLVSGELASATHLVVRGGEYLDDQQTVAVVNRQSL